MKGLSLWQPWASLMAWRDKRIETRSWGTNYRGEVAIHAAKKWDRWLIELCHEEPYRDRIMRRTEPEKLPRGGIVAVGTLVDVIPTDDVRMSQLFRDGAPHEHALGNYAPGRLAWVFENVRPLREPLPFRAMQGLWTVPDHAAAAVRRLAA